MEKQWNVFGKLPLLFFEKMRVEALAKDLVVSV